MATPLDHLDLVLPTDADRATLVGRVHDPDVGPCVVVVRGDRVVDVTGLAPTVSDLLDTERVVDRVRAWESDRSWPLADLLQSTLTQDRSAPWLLAPFDLQVVKAAGVTFAKSMLERVIEEQA